MTNKDQIFVDAINTCEGTINREFIADIIAKDKTNTIKKYLSSYGITQLASHLLEINSKINSSKPLSININDNADLRQKKVQTRPKGIPFDPEQSAGGNPMKDLYANYKYGTGTFKAKAYPSPPKHSWGANINLSSTSYQEQPTFYVAYNGTLKSTTVPVHGDSTEYIETSAADEHINNTLHLNMNLPEEEDNNFDEE